MFFIPLFSSIFGQKMKDIFSYVLCFILFTLSLSILGQSNIDIQGHRGCRGLMPENTIPGFLKALDLGVNTLELDVVITKDKEVLVSHEPFMSHLIATNPEGKTFDKKQGEQYNIYEMTLEEVQQFDCGLKAHPDYPEQEKMAVVKPRLADLIDAVNEHIKANNLPATAYNIEIKRHPKYDGAYHPTYQEFANLVLGLIYDKNIQDQTILQCFDTETLNYVHQVKPDLKTALLVQNLKGPRKNLKKLNFTPAIYSPYFKFVNKKLMRLAARKKIAVIPWTVNEVKDIQRMIEMQVDGIISDYPDRVIKELGN